MKTLFQCDFDGTVTPEDVSFLILDAFGNKNWRQLLEQYREGKIPVAHFNRKAFATVRADEQTLLRFIRDRARIRPGLLDLVAYCRRKGIKFVIVSNGLDFYIQAMLRDIGLGDVDVFAATTRFGADGIEAYYVSPQGGRLEDGFKEAYLDLFKGMGYQVIYAGNGFSDISPGRKAYHVFATGELLAACNDMNIRCTPFVDLNDIVKGLESLFAGKASSPL